MTIAITRTAGAKTGCEIVCDGKGLALDLGLDDNLIIGSAPLYLDMAWFLVLGSLFIIFTSVAP